MLPVETDRSQPLHRELVDNTGLCILIARFPISLHLQYPKSIKNSRYFGCVIEKDIGLKPSILLAFHIISYLRKFNMLTFFFFHLRKRRVNKS